MSDFNGIQRLEDTGRNSSESTTASPSGSLVFQVRVRYALRESLRGALSAFGSSRLVKIPFSSGAVVSKTFEPPPPERANTSDGPIAKKLSITGAALRFRYAASTRRMTGEELPRDVIRSFHWRNRPGGATILGESPIGWNADQSLQVESGAADSPVRNATSSREPPGMSPSARKAPNVLVRPVSLTAETYSPVRSPSRIR